VTRTGVPVYNVSMPLLTRTFSDRPPFRVFEVPVRDRQSAERPPAHSTPPPDRAAEPMRGRRATDAVAS
jgi:hypothetical protein